MVRFDAVKPAINFVLFQAIWLACAFGATNQNLYYAYGLFLILLVWQLWPTNRVKMDCLNILVLLPLGFVLDSIWSLTGLIQYQSHISWFNTAPNWILILWVTFALTLNHSMAWIYRKPKLALVFGAIGGPLSYLAAERIGALAITNKPITLLLLVVAWFLALLICLQLKPKAADRQLTDKHGRYA
ncbi:DUF2878 domain-containing protein [Kangiella sp. TOML190]|uniref:DUF2878 domain-containing protein n=1 Tax=Kangiella sp. TOML190 TaxID=2931351 RepID=UPI00203E0AF4|nr:DUF2878 domain-containing protein [Kangiella sp. TOML190]